MTDKDKLKKLLQIAASNGYKPDYYISEYWLKNNHDNSFTIERTIISCDVNDEPNPIEISINDIVLDYESVGSISFIGALLKALKEKKKELVVFKDGSTEYHLRVDWISKPSSLRLSYLFTAFDLLLN